MKSDSSLEANTLQMPYLFAIRAIGIDFPLQNGEFLILSTVSDFHCCSKNSFNFCKSIDKPRASLSHIFALHATPLPIKLVLHVAILYLLNNDKNRRLEENYIQKCFLRDAHKILKKCFTFSI